MNVTYPRKFAPGDLIRVVAPARSRAMVTEHDHSALIEERFAGMGLRLWYGAHVDERNIGGRAELAAGPPSGLRIIEH